MIYTNNILTSADILFILLPNKLNNTLITTLFISSKLPLFTKARVKKIYFGSNIKSIKAYEVV